MSNENKTYVGKRIAIYGPNFIWRGKCESITKREIVLSDVYQVKNCEHDQTSCNDVFFTDQQTFPMTGICNFGFAKWA